MHIPSSTYRLQFNKDFTFCDLDRIIDYLYKLGISTIYASPITAATPGSMHGYDVIDSHIINPEIGTVDELRSIAAKLKAKGMSWVQDIVPNHMAFTTCNDRLMDVLERGTASEYHDYFDIDWQHPDPELNGRLMVPVLDDSLQNCIEQNKIQLGFSNGYTINCSGSEYPLSVASYKELLPVNSTSSLALRLTEITEKASENNSYDGWKSIKRKLLGALQSHGQEIQECISGINTNTNLLNALLKSQNYILTPHSDTDKKINYRRFFTVNSLICLSMEKQHVFEEYHSFIHELYREELIQGLRIDHIDGLKDPRLYIQRLRNLFGEKCYIISEKILETREEMPENWSLQGTSGYEFLSFTNQVLTDRVGANRLLDHYNHIINHPVPYEETVSQKKELILHNYMAGELDNLVHYFMQLGLNSIGLAGPELKSALASLMICLPVYRIYPEKFPLRPRETAIIDKGFKKAVSKNPQLENALGSLQKLFDDPEPNSENAKCKLEFLKRLMQFTGPLTAKGVEDTSFYIYNPLISHNEVGDSPKELGIAITDFHAKMITRQQQNPLSLNATSTHDTKRGEDARIRISMLSEFAEEWQELVNYWMKINRPLSRLEGQRSMPALNDEYFFYQSLIGGFPVDENDMDGFIERLKEYYIKVLRESKVNSSWAQPDEEYENACLKFIEGILDQQHDFRKSFVPFLKKIAVPSAIYSLNQSLIKITAPGIPDFYQGTEWWDLSYVDPDNRRPVDYERREQSLDRFSSNNTATGKEPELEKQYIIYKSLECRKRYPELFIKGEYIPLPASKGSSFLSYARQYNSKWFIIIVPLGLGRIEDFSLVPDSDVSIDLPPGSPQSWTDVLNGNVIVANDGKIIMNDLVTHWKPVLLESNIAV